MATAKHQTPVGLSLKFTFCGEGLRLAGVAYQPMSRRFQFSLRAMFIAMTGVALIAWMMHLRRLDELARVNAQISELRDAQESGVYPFDFQPQIDELGKRLKELEGH